ncbi:alpha/beta hydrolase [Fluviicola sp.]|uniref:alpha/beta fold hydrolase n=1 Tax=Fluviicola sp. TaxID=1917219 RepID=UPI0031D01CCB
MNEQLLNYRISGNGSPVIFLHGFMEDLSMWEDLIPHLPVRACCIDLPGHGKSAFEPQQTPSIRYMAEEVRKIIEREQLHHPIVVGHSMGGYVALELFRLVPDLEHIVLFHSHPWADPESKKNDRQRVAELVRTKASVFIREAIPNLFYDPSEMGAVISHYVQIAEHMNPEAIGWAALAMKDREDLSRLMEQHPEKFSVISGEKDKLIQVKALADFCKQHHISSVVLPNVGHMAHEENRDEAVHLLNTVF